MVKTYAALYRAATLALRPTEGEAAPQTARELLAMASGKRMEALLADLALYASEAIEEKLQELVEKTAAGCPLAYLLGEWDFYGMTLTVTPDVLIPRDDTMAVTELAIEQVRGGEGAVRVLDLCTGSGCIGLAIARAVPEARVTLGDVSAAALRVAKKNIADLGLARRVTAFELDVKKPAPEFLGAFDLIVANPPYVTKAEMAELEVSVREHEPHLALDGGEDGLDFYRAILRNYPARLKAGGSICFEFGMGQGEAVAAMLREAGFMDVALREDARGVVRAVCGRFKTNV